ncbi:hypothetical protein NKH72_22330 [Mesorhizobium sp. M0955]|uniref:hypothetical protein n=1 Tax=Mesorhizobium sp. M0955 TaxID=2957033 RepID=UPI003339D64B
MKHLKIVAKGWKGYSSVIGGVKFKDGVSVEPVPRHIADRITGGISMVEIHDDGSEHPAGVAHRLVKEARSRAPVVEPLTRATDKELEDEAKLDALRAERAPVERFYTREELEKIVEEKGLRGLREISDPWDVKHRAVAPLIAMILHAQDQFLNKRNQRLQKIADRAEEGRKEAEVERLARLEADRLAEEEADRVASALLGSSVLASVYKAGEVVLQLGTIVEQAFKRSGLTVTGWNRLPDGKREKALAEQVEIFEAHFGEQLVPVLSEKPKEGEEPSEDEERTPECLLGSSVLASTYKIGGNTVELGVIVRGAFAKFGGTADEWNALSGDAREDLLRLELDRLVAE